MAKIIIIILIVIFDLIFISLVKNECNPADRKNTALAEQAIQEGRRHISFLIGINLFAIAALLLYYENDWGLIIGLIAVALVYCSK